MLAGYLLDPAAAELSAAQPSAESYLGADVLGAVEEQDEGQLFADAPWRTVAAEAAAIALLAPVMEERIDNRASEGCSTTWSCRCRPCSRAWRRAASRWTSRTSRRWGSRCATGWRRFDADVYQQAGSEFNLNSPPQLRKILYDQLGLQPGKKTPKGELSTDASVLGEAA